MDGNAEARIQVLVQVVDLCRDLVPEVAEKAEACIRQIKAEHGPRDIEVHSASFTLPQRG